MIGRLDVESIICPNCNGSKQDPKKRKRLCPECGGAGVIERCKSCGELMPCSGTEDYDQTYCSHKK